LKKNIKSKQNGIGDFMRSAIWMWGHSSSNNGRTIKKNLKIKDQNKKRATTNHTNSTNKGKKTIFLKQ